MNNQSKLYLYFTPKFFAVLFLFNGCSVISTNMQQADVNLNSPVLLHRITDDRQVGDLTWRGGAVYNFGRKSLGFNSGNHTSVNADGMYELEKVEGKDFYKEVAGVNRFEYKGENLSWRLADFTGAMEVDLIINQGLALFGGINYSSTGESDQIGAKVGVGFFKAGDNWSVRTDLGLSFKQIRASALVVVGEHEYTNKDRYVFFHKETVSDYHMNPLFTFSVNSKNKNWLINYLFSYTLGWQTFYSFKPDIKTVPHDFPERYYVGSELQYMDAYHILTAGIYKNITEELRLVYGISFMRFAGAGRGVITPDMTLQIDVDIF